MFMDMFDDFRPGHVPLICAISGKPGQIATIKQNIRFHGRVYPEKLLLDQIQNGRLSAITCFTHRAR